MLDGKMPYWGYHLDGNRLGTQRVDVEFNVKSVTDSGLLGYYVGEIWVKVDADKAIVEITRKN